MTALAIGGLGTPELLIIVAALILMFGAAKLPELARGTGRALRIFKDETKGLTDDGHDDRLQTATTPGQQRQELEARQRDLIRRQAELDSESARLDRGEGSA